MEKRWNYRGFEEKCKTGKHLTLVDLGEAVRKAKFDNNYLFKDNVPTYLQPEFHVFHLKHDTGRSGLSGIIRDGGFKNPRPFPFPPANPHRFLWWGLAVGPDEISAAERRLLETAYPDRTEEQKQRQESFLGKFATSPVFKSSSRLGSFRFTFSLKEVLGAYKEQFCGGAEPIMRVMETVLYKQEVLYVVLIHSPANTGQFSHLPLLTDNPDSVCSYKDGGDAGDDYFLWRSEAMCETHRFELVLNDDEKQMYANPIRHVFYNWDNVSLALHVNDQVLTFEREQLMESLKHCEEGERLTIPKGAAKEDYFVDFEEAQEFARRHFDDLEYNLQRA